MVNGRILNKKQLLAVKYGEGPLLIIAGAGSGKTTVITERIKYLILEKNIHPSNILALTFTEKASREMEERIDVVMPYGYTQMWIATFHAFCDRILRSEAINIGLNPNYTLITETEAILFLRKHLFQFSLDYFRPLGNPHKFLEGMLQHFSRLKDEDVSPNEYLSWAQSQNGDEVKKNLELAYAYQAYEELKTKESMMDFSDLIANTLKLFRTRNNILKIYQEQFKYILVDEFQDTNFAQNQLAILLAGERKNITVVGDDDQAIYRWRGAAISNIIQFRKQFPKCKVITLTENYRSTQEILNKSYLLIQQNNPDRLEVKEKVDKKLTSVRNIKGEPIKLIFTERVEDEAEQVAKEIKELVADYHYNDIAILVRANDHAQSFVRSFERAHIPYQFLGPGQLFHQEEIKDLIAYLKVLYNFEDTASLYRILNMTIFKIEPRDIAAVLIFAKKKNLTLFEALEKADETNLTEESKEILKKIVAMIKQHLGRLSKDTAGQILYYFLQDSKILPQLLQTKNEIEERRAKNIAKFFDKLKTYEVEHEDASVFAVIDWIDLSMQMGESPLSSNTDWADNNAVNILTIHSSKGLEFPIVFLVNLVNQRFPTRERKEQIPIPQELIKEILPVGDYHLQEERRLFYVGMTRAQDILFLTGAKYYGEGKRERKISPFVYETLGESYVVKKLAKVKLEKTAVQESLLEWAEKTSQKETAKIKSLDVIPITYLSFSQLQCFDICPLHYKLRYILKIPSEPTAALSFGTSIHSALRDFYQELIQGRKPDKKEIIGFLEKHWINEGYANKQHHNKAFEKAKYVLTNYLENNPTTNISPLGVEVSFQFFLKDLNRKRVIKIGGRIDRVDKIEGNKIEIIDYKTGSNMPKENDLAANLQLTMYALAAMNVNDALFNRNPEDVLLTLDYIEEGKKITTQRTREDLEKAKELIFTKLEEIETSSFACSKSIFCQNCEYKMLCHVL
ncbi:MAG: ATP-dependent helicase [Candidatus Levyibacteriota bacterium]|nr:MAG: ATP-dependent helicase [Candidatus Levybacteria bacterium]